MDHILFSQYSFGRFVPTILSLAITLYLFLKSRRSKRRATLYLALYFLFVTIFNTGYFFAYSIYHESGAHFWILAALAPLGIVFLIQFAYRFPGKMNAREPNIVFIITLFIAVMSFVDYVVQSRGGEITPTITDFETSYYSEIIPVVCLLYFLWVIILFIRQFIRLSEQEKENRGFIARLISPPSMKARAARNFALIAVFEILNAVLVVLFMSFHAMSVATVNILMNLILLVTYTLYIIVFVNSSDEPMMLVKRLAGIILVVVLFIMELTGQIALVVRDRAYDDINRSRLELCGEFIQTGNYGMLPADIDYVLLLNSNKEPETVLSRPGFGAFVPDVFHLYPSTGVSFNLDETHDPVHGAVPYARHYARVRNRNYFHYNIPLAGTYYGFGINFSHYRYYMHSVALLLILSTIFFTAAALAVSPLFLFGGLVKPMRKLLDEIRKWVNYPGDIEDEMVFLTGIVGETLMMNRQLKEEIHKLKQDLIHHNTGRKNRESLSDASISKIQRVTDYIERNYRYDISREGLASYSGMSLSSLSRGFKLYTGMKIGDFINQLRIRDAMIQLEKTDKTVIEIAFSVGFESLRTFNRVFSRINGSTPSEFREGKGLVIQ